MGGGYIRIVELFYSFLKLELGFNKVNKTINGNTFYDIQFKDKEKKRAVSISYGNIEGHLEVIVFILQNGEMSDYDDRTITLR
jgi:hypothetical protein